MKETITLDRKDAEEIACLLDDILGADILLGENEKIGAGVYEVVEIQRDLLDQ